MPSPYSHLQVKLAQELPSWMPSPNMREEPNYGSYSPSGRFVDQPRIQNIAQEELARVKNSPIDSQQRQDILSSYETQFPQGFQPSTNERPLTQDQIQARNQYLNMQAVESGQTPYNPNLFQTHPSGSYGDRLADSFRRIGNRYGGDFQLNYPDDKYLDFSSYALEAAPQIAATALTGGGSAAASTAAAGGRAASLGSRAAAALTAAAGGRAASLGSRAGGALLRGAQPFAQGSSSATARFLGRNIPAAINFAAAPVNPIPFVRSTLAGTGKGVSGLMGSALTSGVRASVMQGAAQNYGQAARNQQYLPGGSSPLSQATDFARSLAMGVRFDPATLTPVGRMGFSPLNFMPDREQFVAANTNGALDEVERILAARDAERRGELLSEPPSSQDVEFYDQNLASLPEEQLVPTLEQMSRQQFAGQNPLSNLYQSFTPSLSSFTGLPQAHRGN